MAKQGQAKIAPHRKTRMPAKIVEATCGLHKVGAVSNDELQKMTMKVLGKDALSLAESGG